MKLLLLVVVLFALLPVAWRHHAVRRVLFLLGRTLLVLCGVHVIAVAGILVYSLLHESGPARPPHLSASATRGHP